MHFIAYLDGKNIYYNYYRRSQIIVILFNVLLMCLCVSVLS